MWMAAQNSESKQRSGKARRAPINHSKINMAGKSSSGSQIRWGSLRSFSSGRSAHRDSALQPDDRRSRFADRRALDQLQTDPFSLLRILLGQLRALPLTSVEDSCRGADRSKAKDPHSRSKAKN